MEVDKVTYGCGECGSPVGDQEYVTNWNRCAPCFDRKYHAYMRKQRIQYLVRRAIPWVLATVICTALFTGVGKLIGHFLYLLSRVN